MGPKHFFFLVFKSCISVVESKIVIPRVKHIYITVFFLQEQFYKLSFVPKKEKSIVIPEDICTKLCAGPIISQVTKWVTCSHSYLYSDYEHHELMKSQKFDLTGEFIM